MKPTTLSLLKYLETIEDISLSNESYKKDLDLLPEKNILKNIVKIEKNYFLKYSNNYNATYILTAET